MAEKVGGLKPPPKYMPVAEKVGGLPPTPSISAVPALIELFQNSKQAWLDLGKFALNKLWTVAAAKPRL